MLLRNIFSSFLWGSLVCGVSGFAAGSKPNRFTQPDKRAPLQDIVTWDEHSLFVRGERIMLFSGEFHPFRLPVPSLWLDIFQKLKAAGFNAVSFYVHWALLEGKEGEYSAEGVFAWEPFFEAATKAGIYLLARPGPYINAEVSGGGFPGWLTRHKEKARTPEFLPLAANYIKHIGKAIAKAQITNGGPVIALQPENEYTLGIDSIVFPDGDYMQSLQDMFRAEGVIVPTFNNDAWPRGLFAPGWGKGEVDIYGHDGYPLGFDCANPYNWPDNNLPGDWRISHDQQSPSTPYGVFEFQGGAFDPWGGQGFEKCTALLSPEFERVFYKNNYAFAMTIFNIYMVYGGSNWGNLGHAGGYSSYDYGAIIAEDRTVSREKYSELKLQANFFKVSPAYVIADPGNATAGGFVNNPAITTTQLATNKTNLYVVRHTKYNSLEATDYKLVVPTSAGNLTIPQVNGTTLTLNGRDSKIHVTDYDVGGINMLYSSAEVFTWQKYSEKTVLVLYGGSKETHEAAFVVKAPGSVTEGSGVRYSYKNGVFTINWKVTPQRKIVKVGGLYVYLLDRNDAYNYWVVDIAGLRNSGSYGSSKAQSQSVIARAGYLVRTASVTGGTLALTGDVNATTTLEIIGGAPRYNAVTFNGKRVSTFSDKNGNMKGTVQYPTPNFRIPSLPSLSWKYVDSLPEIQSGYDDSAWPKADHTTTNNTFQNLTTPTSLWGPDYGFNAATYVFRGHFKATGSKSSFSLLTFGGQAYGSSIYLDDTFLDGFPGLGPNQTWPQDVTLPKLTAGKEYVLTIVMDNMGIDGDWWVGSDTNKNARGILNYTLAGHEQSDITWKITGNLGGEDYVDRARGPLNEGGMWAERQGYHLPNPPTAEFEAGSPYEGISKPGIGFYTTSFDLAIPEGWDVPLHFVFANTTGANFRSQLFVNGYQFGKYINNVGPQTSYPVPQGILNYSGTNYLAVSLWGFDEGGNKLGGLELVPAAKIVSGFGNVELSPQPAWKKREGAY